MPLHASALVKPYLALPHRSSCDDRLSYIAYIKSKVGAGFVNGQEPGMSDRYSCLSVMHQEGDGIPRRDAKTSADPLSAAAPQLRDIPGGEFCFITLSS